MFPAQRVPTGIINSARTKSMREIKPNAKQPEWTSHTPQLSLVHFESIQVSTKLSSTTGSAGYHKRTRAKLRHELKQSAKQPEWISYTP